MFTSLCRVKSGRRVNVSHLLALPAKSCCFCDGCLGFCDEVYMNWLPGLCTTSFVFSLLLCSECCAALGMEVASQVVVNQKPTIHVEVCVKSDRWVCFTPVAQQKTSRFRVRWCTWLSLSDMQKTENVVVKWISQCRWCDMMMCFFVCFLARPHSLTCRATFGLYSSATTLSSETTGGLSLMRISCRNMWSQ